MDHCIWTIGHSTRSIEQFIELLQTHSIQLIADVRRYPGSRRHPQFNAEALSESLRAHDIAYVAALELGGRRKALPDSPHTVWRHAAFRGYADYMDTAQFQIAVEKLVRSSRQYRTAIMCSEALWWQCHRSMIADALKAQGIRVLHIMAMDKVAEHPFTSAASIVDGRLHYGSTNNQSNLPL